MTKAEREMLTAIRDLLDIPQPADYDDRQRYYDTLTIRITRLAGCLNVVLSSNASVPGDVTQTVRHFAAEPLRYVPETPQQADERRAWFKKYGGSK